MRSRRSKLYALLPVGLALSTIGPQIALRNSQAFGLHSDFWSGIISGLGIGLLLVLVIAKTKQRGHR